MKFWENSLSLMTLFRLLSQFSKEVLANIYSAYIDNFLNAKDAVRIAKEAKPAFMKFLEVCFSACVCIRVCIPLGFMHGSGSPACLCYYIRDQAVRAHTCPTPNDVISYFMVCEL